MPDTPNATPSAREIIETARHRHGRFESIDEVALIARDPEHRLTRILVQCALCQFTAAAQDVARLVRYVERGKDDGDYVRDFSLALQPGDVEADRR